jgi:hypothetical protein
MFYSLVHVTRSGAFRKSDDVLTSSGKVQDPRVQPRRETCLEERKEGENTER